MSDSIQTESPPLPQQLRTFAAELIGGRADGLPRDPVREEWNHAGAVLNAAEELERLDALINEAAKHWLSLEPPVRWEGAIDSAMEAAVGEIQRLRLELVKTVNESMSILIEAEDEDNGYSEELTPL